MFRSSRRDVVYSQAEHQRLAGAIAAAWRPELVPLPFAPFVRGVAVHDRGYGELDTDEIGSVEPARWVDIQRGGTEPQDDPVTDLVVALHVDRLARGFTPFDARVEERLTAAGVAEADALAADATTELCDRLAFSFCREEAAAGTIGGIAYTLDADGAATLAPWPLAVEGLRETVVGYAADGYPALLEPVERDFVLTPA